MALLDTLGVTLDEKLLKRALTHKSHPDAADYERLEFLGDRVLNLCVADLLYQTYPDYTEGQLAKHYAGLVRAETLAQIAVTWQLEDEIRLGKSARGGIETLPQDSILADAVEAILAVVYLEHGLNAVQKIVQQFWTPLLERVELQDPKSALQELLQADGKPTPKYTVIDSRGKDHDKSFTLEVSCALGNATATGSSKQKAAREAARALLNQLNIKF